MSYVYFIGAITHPGKSAAVKIGYSASNPNKRLKSLQIGHPGELYLLSWIEGTMDDERALHRRFEQYHERGEWFRLEGDLDKYVLKLVLGEPV